MQHGLPCLPRATFNDAAMRTGDDEETSVKLVQSVGNYSLHCTEFL